MNDVKNVPSQEGFPARDADLVHAQILKMYGQAIIFREGQFPSSRIPPSLAHPAPAIAAIGNIQFRHERTVWWRVPLPSGHDVFSCPPQGGTEPPVPQDPTILPNLFKPQDASIPERYPVVYYTVCL
jgi:hypothetical protein